MSYVCVCDGFAHGDARLADIWGGEAGGGESWITRRGFRAVRQELVMGLARTGLGEKSGS